MREPANARIFCIDYWKIRERQSNAGIAKQHLPNPKDQNTRSTKWFAPALRKDDREEEKKDQ